MTYSHRDLLSETPMTYSHTISTTFIVVRTDPPDTDGPQHDAFDRVIEVDVQGKYVVGERGSFTEPPEGPWIEDISATVDGKPFYLTDGELDDVTTMLVSLGEDG